MKYVLCILLCLLSYGKKVDLPDDSGKLTVTVFAKNTDQANALVASDPVLKHYKIGNHYNVYTPNHPMVSRFGRPTYPSAMVQYANGVIAYRCPWRERYRKDEPKDEEPADEEEEEPQPEPEHGPATALLLALGLLGVGGGVGLRFYQEMKQ